LGIAFHTGALDDATAGGSARSVSVDMVERDATSAPAEAQADPGAGIAVTRTQNRGELVAGMPTSSALSLRVGPSVGDGIGLDDLGEVDPLVAPYAGALLGTAGG